MENSRSGVGKRRTEEVVIPLTELRLWLTVVDIECPRCHMHYGYDEVETIVAFGVCARCDHLEGDRQ